MCATCARARTPESVARAMHRNHLARERPDRLFEGLLYAQTVILTLPSDEPAAIIFNGQSVTRHLISPVGWNMLCTMPCPPIVDHLYDPGRFLLQSMY